MAVRVRLYDVEPKEDRPGLPSWATNWFDMDIDPQIGDELKVGEVDDNNYLTDATAYFWRVIRRSLEPAPRGGTVYLTLGVRYVS